MNETRNNPPPKWTAHLLYVTGAATGLAIALVAGVGIAGLAGRGIHETEGYEKWLGSSILTVIYVGMIFVASVIVRHTRLRTIVAPAMAAAMLFSAATLAIILLTIWLQFPLILAADWLGALGTSMTLLTIVLLHNGGFSCMFIRSGSLRIAVIVTAVCAWLVVLPIVASFVWYVLRGSEALLMTFGPLGSTLGFIGLVGSALLSGMVRRSNRKWNETRESIAQKPMLALECPECGSAQNLRAGPAKCGACGLLMNIEIEEPRCECGYVLYKLARAVCPECGRDVPKEFFSAEIAEARMEPQMNADAR